MKNILLRFTYLLVEFCNNTFCLNSKGISLNLITIVKLMLISVICMPLMGQNSALSHYEGFYLTQETYPSGVSALDWFPDDYEVQGVANDGTNWFITIIDQDKTHGIMWRIPKGVALNGNVSGEPGVDFVNYSTIPELQSINATHWGDPDHIRYNNTDYILVPIYSVVACFRADNLEYINYANFDSHISDGGGWCAVGVDNDLYTSVDDPTSILRYDVNWDQFLFTNNHNVLTYIDSYDLHKPNGTPLFMTDMQGGEFSETGEMLYLVSGRGACLEWIGLDGAEWTPNDGIHAITTSNWTQVAQSLINNNTPSTYFWYNYDPTCIICWLIVPVGGGTDTPEGLTVWNLDDGSAPGIIGSLHVLVDRYLIGGTNCDDELYFHHFSSKIHVNKNVPSGPGLLGTQDNPFQSFDMAYTWYPAWDGCEIVIKAGSYPAGGQYSTRVRIVSQDGSAILGSSGVQLFQDLNYTGNSCFIEVNCPNLDIPSIDFNDRTSSIKLFNLSSVRLYTDINYSGNSIQVTGNVPNLENYPGINDEVSSVKLISDK